MPAILKSNICKPNHSKWEIPVIIKIHWWIIKLQHTEYVSQFI